MNGGDDFSCADTLAAFLLFADDFECYINHITAAVVYYKVVLMLNAFSKTERPQREKDQIIEHLEHYRNNMMLAIASAADDFKEIVDEDTAFRTAIMKKTSKVIGEICDELLGEYDYGDIIDLLDQAEDVDISDFIIDDDEDYNETDD